MPLLLFVPDEQFDDESNSDCSRSECGAKENVSIPRSRLSLIKSRTAVEIDDSVDPMSDENADKRADYDIQYLIDSFSHITAPPHQSKWFKQAKQDQKADQSRAIRRLSSANSILF